MGDCKGTCIYKTQIHQIDTLKTIHQKRCGENNNVRTHLEELVALQNRLVGMGATVDEPQFHTIILSSLPESYQSFVAAITVTANLTKTTVSNNDLVHILANEYYHYLISSIKAPSGGSALTATEFPKKPKASSASIKSRDSTTVGS